MAQKYTSPSQGCDLCASAPTEIYSDDSTTISAASLLPKSDAIISGRKTELTPPEIFLPPSSNDGTSDASSELQDLLAATASYVSPQTDVEWAYVLCFAAEVEYATRAFLKSCHCNGCFITSLSQQDHTCLQNVSQGLNHYLELVFEDLVDEHQVHFGFHALCIMKEWKYVTSDKVRDLAAQCRTTWRDIIIEVIRSKYEGFSEDWIDTVKQTYKSISICSCVT